MRTTHNTSKRVLGVTVAALAAAVAALGCDGADPGAVADARPSSAADAGTVAPAQTPVGLQFDGAWVSPWLREAVERIALDETNTFPLIRSAEPIEPSIYFWDFWPVRTPDNEVANIDGYTVVIGLTAPRDVAPGARHGVAEWGYFYRRGQQGEWTYGGPVFAEGEALGERQWAGSANYDPSTGRITFFYTALGNIDFDGTAKSELTTDPFEDVKYGGESVAPQVIVETRAAVSTTGGVSFVDFSPHTAILQPDGNLYATGAQALAGDLLFVFRDPFYFVDPADGVEYLLFTAAAGPWRSGRYKGVAGLATRRDGSWVLLPPLLGAFDVNSQVERPNLLVQDGRYYLFFTSHAFSFAPGLSGPEGLYGFAADQLRGHYLPLNGSGLVLGNPDAAPLQTYSYLVLPGGVVTAFVNWVNLGEVTLEGIADQTEQWRRERFIGSPAPPLSLRIEGLETSLAGWAESSAVDLGSRR